MPTNTGNMSQLLAPGLRKVFFQYLREKPQEYASIFNINPSKRAYEEDLMIAGLGTMPQKTEGSPIIYQDPIQGTKKRYTHLTYGLGFRVTMEMYEDDLYGPMNRMAKELAKAARNVREVVSANVLNNSFSTSFVGFNTGEALCQSHTLIGGGSYSNTPSTQADIGIASLEAAIINFDTLVDERNMPVLIAPKWLVIHPNDRMIAEELLNSEYRPYTATNEINAVRKFGVSYNVNHYLTDSDAWWLLGDKDDHDLNFFERAATRMQNGDDFDTGDAKYKAFQRFSVGFGDWRGVYGSSGA